MNTMIVLVAIVWGLVVMVEPAVAGCTMTTVILPDGSARFVQTCCYGNGQCIQTWM